MLHLIKAAKQSGLFLFLLGLFYLIPLKDLDKMSDVSVLIIISKICAVLFLLANSSYTPAPNVIHWAALGDACMAIAVFVTYRMFIRGR